ncbi:putative reverse transcriptase domain-containing protein [Tanacetum coccineum]
MLIAKKRVRALPSGRLASRYPPDHSSSNHFSSDDSSSNSPSDSSSGYSSNTSSGRSIPYYSFDTPTVSFVGPSRKRRRSPAISVPLATPVPGAFSPIRANLLPPYKRIRGEDIDGDIAAAEAATAREADVGVEVGIGSDGDDEVESEDRGTIEIRVDRVIKSVQRDQGHRMLVTSQHSVVMLDMIGVLERDNMRLRGMLCVERERETMPTATRTGMTHVTIEEMIERRVAKALEAYRNRIAKVDLAVYGFVKGVQRSRHEDDNGDDNGDGGRIGNGNGLGGGNGDGNPNVNVGGVVPVALEMVFYISNFPWEYQMVLEEKDLVKKFIGGLPDNIQGNVIAAEPTRLQNVVRIANHLMDQKLKGYVARNVKNKKGFDNDSRDNRVQQPPFKRQNSNGQNVARAYTLRNSEKKGYTGPLSYCNKCRLHHEGQYTVKCRNCKRVGHLTRDCRDAVATTTQGAPKPN